MTIIYTILIILGVLLIGPFVAVGAMFILVGSVIGLILFFIVALVGIEPSGGVFLTCLIMGVLVGVASAIAKPQGRS